MSFLAAATQSYTVAFLIEQSVSKTNTKLDSQHSISRLNTNSFSPACIQVGCKACCKGTTIFPDWPLSTFTTTSPWQCVPFSDLTHSQTQRLPWCASLRWQRSRACAAPDEVGHQSEVISLRSSRRSSETSPERSSEWSSEAISCGTLLAVWRR